MWTLRGKRLAVLGLAFKGGTDDIRDSPALEIVKRLAEEGAFIVAFDPAAMARAASQLSGLLNVSFVKSAFEACQGSDALLILTEWQEFKTMDLQEVRKTLRLPIVIDGRNLLIAEEVEAAGLAYYSMGRQATHDHPASRVAAIAQAASASL
jgi:UDPglucose 6-dehydrogenase